MPNLVGRRRQVRLPVTLWAVLFFTACAGTGASAEPDLGTSGPPAASPTLPSAGPGSVAIPSPTPRSSRPPDAARSASVERDGIQVTMTLDANPLTAGEPTWVSTEVRNLGRDDVIWFHDGCAIAVDVRGEMTGVQWRPGQAQSGVAADFKRLALEQQTLDQGVVHIAFTPEAYIGAGRYGCMDVGITQRIAPGEAIHQRARWDGMVQLRLGAPPSGAVDLVGRARYYWRDGEGTPASVTDQAIEVHLDGQIVDGRDRSLLDPPEVIDAALADPAFLRWVTATHIGEGNTPVLWFDPETSEWQVGLLDYDARRFHLVSVDPLSGSVVGTADRAWDPAVDGSW